MFLRHEKTAINEVFFSWLSRLILLLGILVLLMLSVAVLSVEAYLPMEESERIEFLRHGVLTFLAGIGALAGLMAIRRLLVRVRSEWLFCVCGAVWLIAGFYLLFHVDPLLRADAGSVFTGAALMRHGDYQSLEVGRYFWIYPHQLGLAAWQQLWMTLRESVRLFFLLNLLLVLWNSFILWRITALLLPGNRTCQNYTILLCFLFLPELFMILFVYGTIPGLSFALGSVYFAIRTMKRNQMLYWIPCILCMAVACALRNNYFILMIALSITLGLNVLRRKALRQIALVALLILSTVAAPRMLTQYYESRSGLEIGDGAPKVLWLVMGLRDDEQRPTVGGWFDGYNERVLKDAEWDLEQAEEQGKRDLEQRISELRRNPGYTLRFFAAKWISTWCEPTFQSLWSGPLEDRNQFTHTPLLRALYGGGPFYRWFSKGLCVILSLIYVPALGCVWILWNRKREPVESAVMFPILALLGGMTFHLFWETKSQYVWPYVVLLIPLAAAGLTVAGEGLRLGLSQMRGHKRYACASELKESADSV